MKKVIAFLLSLLLTTSVFVLNVSAIESSMQLTNATYPTFLDEQMSFTISGKITSNSKITSVTVGVYQKSTGVEVLKKTETPDKTVYDLADIDPYIMFGLLTEDNYTYKVTASDTNVKNKVLLSKDFVVGLPNGTVGDKMTDVNWKVIDISQWQPDVNWSTLKNEIDGIILRIGYRTTSTLKIYEDSMFYTHYKNATAHSIPVGVYFYSVALTEAAMKEEADFVIDTLKKYDCELQMPAYIDMEYDSQLALGKTMCNKLANLYCEEMLKENYFPGVYCNLNWARTALIMSSLSNYTIWYAQYNSQPSYTGKFEMWQYSDRGKLNSISGDIDLNICYKNIPEYIKRMGYNTEAETGAADYSELDKLILLAKTDMSIYTDSSSKVVETALNAAESVSRNLTKEKQSVVDAAVKGLKTAFSGLVLKGGFEANSMSEVEFDDENKMVKGIPENITKNQLLEKYITLKGLATIELKNLKSDKIVKGSVIYIRVNGVIIAEYTVA